MFRLLLGHHQGENSYKMCKKFVYSTIKNAVGVEH
jgi:hypothetical protein